MALCKKLKHNADNSIDRISDLPDPILRIILSYLPTKTAFSTSILSTRWKNVFPFWVRPVTLDLDDSFLLNPGKKESFPRERRFSDFVDKLFDKNLPCVEIMKLYCKNHYGTSKLTSWVTAAMRLNVRELMLRVSMMNSTADRLFLSLNGCKTLTRLELGEMFKVCVPNCFKLPNLKMMVLFKLILDEVEFDDLLYGCPALEDLSFSHCTFQFQTGIEIQSHVLKKLTIKDNWKYQPTCYFHLDVPKLEVLLYNDWLPDDYHLSNFESLLTAHVNVGFPVQESDGLKEDDSDYGNEDIPWYSHGVWMLVKACSNTVHMNLATRSIYALQLSPAELPVFQNLTCLELGYIMGSKGWEILACLMCSAPNLEKLVFEEGFEEQDGGYSSFEALVKTPPVCLELHLQEIKFLVFKEEVDELRLVEYFLKNGTAIKKLELHCLPYKNKNTLNRLHLLPRQSKIDFHPR